jgi:hypothetical protein
LDLDPELELTTVAAPVGHPDVAVSIGDRPVALVQAEGVARSDRPAEALRDHAMQGALRRLPLLLGAETQPGVAAYLLAVGCAPPRGATPGPPDVEAAERLIEQVAPSEIVVEVAAETMRRVDDAGRRAVAQLREDEFRKRGIRYPDVRVHVTDGPPGTVVIRLNHVTLPLVALPADAEWGHVVGRLGQELAARRHWFVRLAQVDRLTYDLEYLFPELISAAHRAFSQEEVAACLRELLRCGRRIRNVPRIMWLMLEQGDAHGQADVLRLSESPLTPRGGNRNRAGRDPVVLAARVRKIAAEEAWRLGNFSVPSNIRRLHPSLEERLTDAADGAEWEVVRALAADPKAGRVVTRTIEAIGPVRDAIQALDRPPRVMASQELPPDIDLDQFQVLEGAQQRGTRAGHKTSLRRS